MELVWLAAGLIVGAAGALFMLGRLSDRRVVEAEERVETQLQHARDEALQADLAHNETKQRLIELQLAQSPLQDRIATAEQRAQAAEKHAKDATAKAALQAQEAEAQLRAREAEIAAAKAVQAASALPALDVRARRLKAIDAKLAMLPAGSSARAALETERGRLAAD